MQYDSSVNYKIIGGETNKIGLELCVTLLLFKVITCWIFQSVLLLCNIFCICTGTVRPLYMI